MLNKLKLYLPESEGEDEFLQLLLDVSERKILDRLYPFDASKTVVPERYQLKQIEIALYLYNRQGSEGQLSHNENSISRAYESADVPESLMQGITPFVGSIF